MLDMEEKEMSTKIKTAINNFTNYIVDHYVQILAAIALVSSAFAAFEGLGGTIGTICAVGVAVLAIMTLFVKILYVLITEGITDATKSELESNSVAILQAIVTIYETYISTSTASTALEQGEVVSVKNAVLAENKTEDTKAANIAAPVAALKMANVKKVASNSLPTVDEIKDIFTKCLEEVKADKEA